MRRRRYRDGHRGPARGFPGGRPASRRGAQERSLLDEAPAVAPGYLRREAAGKLARLGGAAVLASLIYSVDIGTAAAAAVSHLAAGCAVSTCTGITSCGTQTGTGTNTQCNSGLCYCSTLTSGGIRLPPFTASSCLADGTTCTTNCSHSNLCSTSRRSLGVTPAASSPARHRSVHAIPRREPRRCGRASQARRRR